MDHAMKRLTMLESEEPGLELKVSDDEHPKGLQNFRFTFVCP